MAKTIDQEAESLGLAQRLCITNRTSQNLREL